MVSLIFLWWLKVLGDYNPSMIPLPRVTSLLRSYFISFLTISSMSVFAIRIVDFFLEKDFIYLDVYSQVDSFLLVFQLAQFISSAAKKFYNLVVPIPAIPKESFIASSVH
jgi:hypothetical protein